MGDKRVVRLRVIGGSVDIDDVVPPTRAQCPTERDRLGNVVCAHVRCRHHNWLINAEDRLGSHSNADPPGSTLRPVWLYWPIPPACSIDVAERGELDPDDVGRILGRGASLIRLVVNRVRRKRRAEFDDL